MGFLRNRRNKIINKYIVQAIRAKQGAFRTDVYYEAAEEFVIDNGGIVITHNRMSRVDLVLDGIKYAVIIFRASTGYAVINTSKI